MAPIWTRNCDTETEVPVNGEVIAGEIPSWIDGVLIRNGPGKTRIGDTSFNHVFDGMAILQKITIKDGAATYMSKFLKSESYKKNMAANRIVCSEFGTVRFPDPCQTLWQRVMVRFFPQFNQQQTDNCLVNVCYFGDKLYAMTETPFLRQVDPETLDTLGEKVDLTHHVAVNHATAHPHVMPDGTVFNMGNCYSEKGGPYYSIVEFPPCKPGSTDKETSVFEKAKIVAKIPARWKMHPSYYHSFAITTRYWIFLEQPLCLSVPNILSSKLLGQPFTGAFKYYPNEKVRIHVISRDTGEEVPQQYFSPAFFCFHHINAYEDDEHIVIDLCLRHGSLSLEDLYFSRLKEASKTDEPLVPFHPKRIILPLQPQESEGNLITLDGTQCRAEKQKDGSVLCIPEDLSTDVMDLPRINYNFNGKPYEYFYAGGFEGSARLCKDDTQAGLVILDPISWTALARVTFRACGAVTQNFHGQFAGPESVHLF